MSISWKANVDFIYLFDALHYIFKLRVVGTNVMIWNFQSHNPPQYMDIV